MGERGYSVKETARAFRVHSGTIRRWIRLGCPVLELGSVGTGHGSRLDMKKVERWLLERKVPMVADRSNADVLTLLEQAIVDLLRTDGLAGKILPTEYTLLRMYARLFLNLNHRQLEEHDLPVALNRLRANPLDSGKGHDGQRQRR